MQRAQRLPLEAVDGKAVGVALADALGPQALAPVLLVALRAGEIELALPLVVERAARLEERPRRAVDRDAHRQAARLMRDQRGQRQQRLGFVGERRGLLALGAAVLDARLQVQEAAELGVVERDSAWPRP